MNRNFEEKRKWTTIIDTTGTAGIFFKYQGGTLHALEAEDFEPRLLGDRLLSVIKFGTTITFDFSLMPDRKLFDSKYFPVEVLHPDFLRKFENVDILRYNFPEKYTDLLVSHEEFRLVFYFTQNKVPDIFWEKTEVIEICKPEEIEQKLEEREAAKTKSTNQKEESKKQEEKTATKKIPIVTQTKATNPPKQYTKNSASTPKSTTTTKSVLTKSGNITKAIILPDKKSTILTVNSKSLKK